MLKRNLQLNGSHKCWNEEMSTTSKTHQWISCTNSQLKESNRIARLIWKENQSDTTVNIWRYQCNDITEKTVPFQEIQTANENSQNRNSEVLTQASRPTKWKHRRSHPPTPHTTNRIDPQCEPSGANSSQRLPCSALPITFPGACWLH